MSRNIRNSLILIIAVSASAVGFATTIATPRQAAPQANRLSVSRGAAGVLRPVATCDSLSLDDVTGVKDASNHISSAEDETYNGTKYCDVKGYISPHTNFELLLPETTFHGDYVQEGCTEFCGLVNLSTPSQVSDGSSQVAGNEFALGTDDQGHESTSGTDGVWAKNNLALRVVFGYTSEHSLANLARAVISKYYGAKPRYSYFDGCSDGGHEALDLAQRYPTDFNGIIGGAPANNWAPLLGIYESWLVRANTAGNGTQILTREKLPALHAAVMADCANSHGVILDPRTCTFNPASIECARGTDTNSCLTPAQVKAAISEYRGPTDPRGRQLYDGGLPYGSELEWTWFIEPSTDPAAPGDSTAGQLGINYLKYMAYVHNPRASFTLRDFKFDDISYNKLKRFGGVYNATDPDLSAFKRAGGKLILYHGWADQAISPWSTLDYYSAVIKTMGGYANTQTFSRLYMVLGGYHCLNGGDPSVSASFLTPLLTWVEKGQAPSSLTFPVLTQTTGTKSVSLTIASFNPTLPAPKNDGLNSNYHYIGIKSAYEPHNETWWEQHGGHSGLRNQLSKPGYVD